MANGQHRALLHTNNKYNIYGAKHSNWIGRERDYEKSAGLADWLVWPFHKVDIASTSLFERIVMNAAIDGKSTLLAINVTVCACMCVRDEKKKQHTHTLPKCGPFGWKINKPTFCEEFFSSFIFRFNLIKELVALSAESLIPCVNDIGGFCPIHSIIIIIKSRSLKFGNVYGFYVCRPPNESWFHSGFNHRFAMCTYVEFYARSLTACMLPHKIYNNRFKRFRKQQHHTRQNKLWNELTTCFSGYRVQTKREKRPLTLDEIKYWIVNTLSVSVHTSNIHLPLFVFTFTLQSLRL